MSVDSIEMYQARCDLCGHTGECCKSEEEAMRSANVIKIVLTTSAPLAVMCQHCRNLIAQARAGTVHQCARRDK